MVCFRLSVLFTVISLLTACGGGGGGNGDASSATSSYLFYSQGLTAVDPQNPTSRTEVVAAANLVTDTPVAFLAMRYDAANNTLSNIRTHAVVYAHTDGHLYKVSALASESLTPVQISSESQADQMCELWEPNAIEDFANPDDSQYLYLLPGGDGICRTSDDIHKMVRLGMGPSEAPVFAKKTVEVIYDPATGAITGWLVNDTVAGELQRCDARFENCTGLMSTSKQVTTLLFGSINFSFITLDVGGMLLVYDTVQNTLSSPLFTSPSGASIFGENSDATWFYFSAGKQLYQAPIDGSVPATPLATESMDIGDIWLTENSIIYVVIDDADKAVEIKSLPKTGGMAISLVTATGSDELSLQATVDNRVYYNVQLALTSGTTSVVQPVVAGVIDDNGMNRRETADAAWSGLTLSGTWQLSSPAVSSSLINKLFRLDGYTTIGTTAGGGYAGATLVSVDTADLTEITVGTLPDVDPVTAMDCFGLGTEVLCTTEFVLPATTPWQVQSDIFYVNGDTTDSLSRITNTPTEAETSLFF